jgi:hypothetical protein
MTPSLTMPWNVARAKVTSAKPWGEAQSQRSLPTSFAEGTTSTKQPNPLDMIVPAITVVSHDVADGSPASAVSQFHGIGMPASKPASGTPASGTPASWTPASGSPASGGTT